MRDGVLVPDWPAPANVQARVTTRHLNGGSRPPFDRCNLGVRSGDDLEVVNANRASLIAELDLPSSPRWLQQVHGIEIARAPDAGLETIADGAMTHAPGIVLAVLTADCLPILLCSADGAAIATVHAGWRGLAAGVVEAGVRSVQAPAGRVLAWLGPAIGPASYEVGEEVRAAFVDSDPGAESAFKPTRPGHWHCDLYALARRRLAAAGVKQAFGGGFDTFTDTRFYSYRREARTGRFATLLWRS